MASDPGFTVSALGTPPTQRAWSPDILGPGYDQLTLDLADDDEGPVVATLVRREPILVAGDAGVDVLYIHGWSDYFFQTELADFWAGLGARFYALDLRKYGRSLRPGQTPGFVTDLDTYDEDIEAALAAMAAAGEAGRRLVLMGHSTGGLTLSLWTARNQDRVAGLVLNSPWLEFQTRQVGRIALAPVINLQARLDPRAQLPTVDFGFYTRSVSKSYDGEWEYDPVWRPEHGFPVHPAWLSAVFAGHGKVAKGLGITVPIVTLLSARSTLLPRWTSDMMRSDTALDVVGVARRVPDLGLRCTILRIDGALHDIFLSAPAVRAHAYAELAHWFRAHLLVVKSAPPSTL